MDSPAASPIGSKFRTGTKWYQLPGATSTKANNADGDTHFVPIRIDANLTIDRISLETTVASAANGVIRFGIWSDKADRWGNTPGVLLKDLGTISAAAVAGNQTLTPASTLTLAPGLYWFSVTFQGAPATQATYRTTTQAPLDPDVWLVESTQPAANSAAVNCLFAAAFAAAAATLGTEGITAAPTVATVAGAPRLSFRVA